MYVCKQNTILSILQVLLAQMAHAQSSIEDNLHLVWYIHFHMLPIRQRTTQLFVSFIATLNKERNLANSQVKSLLNFIGQIYVGISVIMRCALDWRVQSVARNTCNHPDPHKRALLSTFTDSSAI